MCILGCVQQKQSPLTTKNRPGGRNLTPLEGLGVCILIYMIITSDDPRDDYKHTTFLKVFVETCWNLGGDLLLPEPHWLPGSDSETSASEDASLCP